VNSRGNGYIDWELQDPKGRPPEEVRATRGLNAAKVGELVTELDAHSPGRPAT
jgi:hypothetical protein